jgi:cytosine/adenosine deaminase-related metal-dependent hydrolase
MSSFLLTNVRIFDGESSIERGYVLVREGRIAEVSTEKIKYDGLVYDKPGHTLLPGLIDGHIHADSGNVVALPQSLRFGVTTVCDMHNEWNNIEKLRRQIKDGDCADLKTTSFAATIEGGWPAAIVLMSHDTPEVSIAKLHKKHSGSTNHCKACLQLDGLQQGQSDNMHGHRYGLKLRPGQNSRPARMERNTCKHDSKSASTTSS